jgi:SAM-dependent methyltransferase
MKNDPAYEAKVNLIRKHLPVSPGLILDIGGNVAGEAIVLQQFGRRFLVGDINDVALGVSKKRCEVFDLKQPHYLTMDVHNLPIRSDSLSTVTVIEALHHFYSYEQALSEIFRILEPGGKFVSLEPNGWDPIRRLSEVRDRFRGTIEKSFYQRQIRRLCQNVGFESVRIYPVSLLKSASKFSNRPPWRKSISSFYARLSHRYPVVFGNLLIEAYKPQ